MKIRHGFTLIELMIVVAIITVLISIVFKVVGSNSADAKHNTTVVRLQRLENCLSGYYAAFGSYPPVPLHNSRDIGLEADSSTGAQGSSRAGINWSWSKIGDEAEKTAWKQVRNACRAQPVAAYFPFDDSSNDKVEKLAQEMRRRCSSGEYSNYTRSNFADYDIVSRGFSTCTVGDLSGQKDYSSWSDVQLFKFGLMSYLLPRYLFMMRADRRFYSNFAQWTENNRCPKNPLTGRDYDNGWDDIFEYVNNNDNTESVSQDYASVEAISSQAVCSRWLVNLNGQCTVGGGKLELYGVNISDGNSIFTLKSGEDSTPPDLEYFQSDSGRNYVLDSVTVRDGYNNQFYYYSQSPHQSYSLWSAGANGRTFPPWIDRTALGQQANKCISLWIEDDVAKMSH